MIQKSPEESLNLVQIYCNRVCLHPSRIALLYKQGGMSNEITWEKWAQQVQLTALGLFALGVGHGDRIGLLSENRPEWTYADLGILSLGAVTVPIYPTANLQDIQYVVEDAGMEVLMVSTLAHLDRVKHLLERGNCLKKIVVFEKPLKEDHRVLSLSTLHEKGRCENLNNTSLYKGLVDAVRPEDIATLIYTSGTTGPPKGVMLTHLNFVANYLGAKQLIPVGEEDVALSFLPLSHVFERLAGYYFMLAQGAQVAYAENMLSVPEDLLAFRPTVAAAVPRFFEKMYGNIYAKVHLLPPLKQKLFHWAIKIGQKAVDFRDSKRSLSPGLFLKYRLADWLVLAKIRKGVGGRIRFFISGGAPLDPALAKFFYSVGILILEGYGLTETSPVIAVNAPAHFKFGSVGKVLPNVSVRIAEDGEILTRGPCLMKGYYKKERETQEVMRDGWFCTGDLGELDPEGYLKITGRKKDIIVTSGGKNISPQNIESRILRDNLFSQVVVIGDRKNYLVALIVPNADEVREEANNKGLNRLTLEALFGHPEILSLIEDRLKAQTKDLAPYEQIKYFSLLKHEFTVASGELTPTLKIKRKVVMDKYKDLIDELYRKGAQYQPKAGAKG